jgi:CRP/FNR family transcriptional regulator, cyclic AMP receptor protein
MESIDASGLEGGLTLRNSARPGATDSGRRPVSELRADTRALRRHANVCWVLAEDPDLAEGIAPAERQLAVEQCAVREVRLQCGGWSGRQPDLLPDGIGLLVLDGLLIRRVGIEGEFGAELLGQGDILRPWQGEDAVPTLSRTSGWRVLQPTRLALLDRRAAQRFARYPQLTGRLVARALERSRNLAINMAIVHHGRVETRLHMLFWHLADRWGRVRKEGVVVPLRLTHSVLADLVSARRPTVTSALSRLSAHGLIRAERGGWLLSGEPPGELLDLQTVHVGSRSRAT